MPSDNPMLENGECEQVLHCLLCPRQTPERDQWFEGQLGLVEPYGVRRCPGCGLRWLSPRPTAAAYDQLYSYDNYFAGGGTPEHYDDVAAARTREFRARLRRLEQSRPAKTQLRILDVGAATGEFVREALARGHHADGLEPSKGARDEARDRFGITLLDTPLSDLEADGVYDVVHMSHVLEHVPDPAQTMADAYRLLAHGGEVVIEIPQQFHNDLDRMRRWLRLAKAPVFDAYSLHHTYFFTPETVATLATRAGFAIESLTTALKARTPLWPPTARMIFLRCFLWAADRTHRAGNIIELRARKPDE